MAPTEERLDSVVTAELTNVPDVGQVMAGLLVRVAPKVYAPVNVTAPPIVIVLDPLFTPVPP
jgi:hypothetical protein